MSSIINSWKKVYSTLAHSLTNVVFIEEGENWKINREEYNSHLGNFSFITEISTGAYSISDKNTLGIYVKSEYSNQIMKNSKVSRRFDSKHGFYLFKPQKIKSPVAYDISVRKFSYDSRQRETLLVYESISRMASALEIPKNEVENFERFPRAMLHCFNNANFWLLEDNGSNLLGTAISFEIEAEGKDQNMFVLYFVIPKALRKEGYGSYLLRSILAETKGKTSVIVFTEKTPIANSFLTSHGFELLIDMDLLK